jgi:hypothetical protein
MDLFSFALSLPLLVQPAPLNASYHLPAQLAVDPTISTTLTWPAGWWKEDGVLQVGHAATGCKLAPNGQPYYGPGC